MANQADNSVIDTVVQLLCESGLSHMADAMRLMLNEAMRIAGIAYLRLRSGSRLASMLSRLLIVPVPSL